MSLFWYLRWSLLQLKLYYVIGFHCTLVGMYYILCMYVCLYHIAMATTFSEQVILIIMNAMWYKYVIAWFVTHVLVNLYPEGEGYIYQGV